jgi:putative hydrolase of the HAD superfamily
MFLVVTT